MNPAIAYLDGVFAAAIADAGFAAPENAALVRASDRPDLSDFQSNAAMLIAKSARMDPRRAAGKIVAAITAPDLEISVDGPGFINIRVGDELVAKFAGEVISAPGFGVKKDGVGKTLVVDYGGPNVAKALHVGHLRPAIIGEALKNLARFKGWNVIGDAHLGDWGLPMGMLIAAIKERGLALPMAVDALNKLYPEASKRSKEDAEFMSRAQEETKKLQDGDAENRAIWKSFVATSIWDMRRIYDALGVEFDLWLGESDANDDVNMLVGDFRSRGLSRPSEGAEIVDLSDYPMNGGPVPPFIVVKSNGAVMYGMTDVGTLYDRLRRKKADMVWYVAGTPQALHFHQVFAVAAIAGIKGAARLEHLGNGSVLGADGTPFKTRSGDTVKLGDFIAGAVAEAEKRIAGRDMPATAARDIAVAAIKFADLINPRASDYVFDVGKFLSFEGRTGPYVLYTAVRIRSLLKNAVAPDCAPIVLQNRHDRALALKLCGFSDAVDRAFSERAVNVFVQYVYELAVAYNAFYHECRVLAEPDAALKVSRLVLSAAALKAFEVFAGMIRVNIPERM